MKTAPLSPATLSHFSLAYVSESLRAHGVSLEFLNELEDTTGLSDHERACAMELFLEALKDTCAHSNSWPLIVRHWPLVCAQHPQWDFHCTTVWDSVVDLCTMGFPTPLFHPDINLHHVVLTEALELGEHISPLLRAELARQIFDQWTTTQWEEYFSYLERLGSLEKPEEHATFFKVWNNLLDFTSKHKEVTAIATDWLLASRYIAITDQSLSNLDGLFQTPLGKEVRANLQDHQFQYQEILAAHCKEIDGRTHRKHALFVVGDRWANWKCSPQVNKDVLRGCLGFWGQDLALSEHALPRYRDQYSAEINFIHDLWAQTPAADQQQVWKGLDGIYYLCRVRLLNLLLLLDFNVESILDCLTPDEEEYLNFPKNSAALARVQSQRLRLVLAHTEHAPLPPLSKKI